MKMKYIRRGLVAFSVLAALWLSGCQTSTTPAGSATTETTANRSLAPQRVDIRGNILMRRYDQGQMILEVDGLAPSTDSRYNRAYVLVLPTTQMVGTDGQPIILSELQQGQRVAIILRGGGKGSAVGLGVARKLWVEEPF